MADGGLEKIVERGAVEARFLGDAARQHRGRVAQRADRPVEPIGDGFSAERPSTLTTPPASSAAFARGRRASATPSPQAVASSTRL
jgi:hypothetical protein